MTAPQPVPAKADREAAAWAMNRATNLTFEQMVDYPASPDKVWQMNRVAEAMSRHRIAAQADLLEALRGSLAALDKVFVDWDGEPEDMIPVIEARSAARAAIAAAQGEG